VLCEFDVYAFVMTYIVTVNVWTQFDVVIFLCSWHGSHSVGYFDAAGWTTWGANVTILLHKW